MSAGRGTRESGLTARALLPLISGLRELGHEPGPLLVFYEVFDVVVTLWSHSNTRLPSAFDRVLRYIVVTPDLHRIHHSAWKPETNSNFGAVFPVWDLVSGTFRAEARDGHERMRLGLDEVRGRDAQRPLWLLVSIGRRSLRSQGDDMAMVDRAPTPEPLGEERARA